MQPDPRDIQMVWRAVHHAIAVLDRGASAAQKAFLRANMLTQRGKVRTWMRANPALRGRLSGLDMQIGNVIARIDRGDGEMENWEAFAGGGADFADAPPLHVDLYEARLFIQGRKRQILANAFAAAKRLAAQHGVAALRHEAYQRQALRQGFMQTYLQANPVPVHRGKAAADKYRRELMGVAQRAEGELMAMLGALRSMVLRLAVKGATKGLLGESEASWEAAGDFHSNQPPQFNTTKVTNQAAQSKKRWAIEEARRQERARRLAARRAAEARRRGGDNGEAEALAAFELSAL